MSRPVPRPRVGDRLTRGQLTTTLYGDVIRVNLALHGVGLVADIDDVEAVEFALALIGQARQLRAARNTSPE